MQRPARGLFFLALLSTAVAIVGVSLLLRDLYGHSMRAIGSEVGSGEVRLEEPITVAVGRTPGGPGEWAAYAAAFSQMEEDINRPIVVRYALDRVTVHDLIDSGEADVALIPVDTYLDLSEHAPVTLIASPIVGGRPEDTAVVVVAADSDIRSMEELRDGRIALTSGSLSGEVFVRWLVGQEDESAEEFFGQIEPTDTQDQALSRVAKGEADATSVRRSALYSWHEGEFRTIAESPDFGMPPIVAREGLSAAVVEAMRRSLLSTATRDAIPPGSALDGFAVPTDGDYEFSRTLRAAVLAAQENGDDR